MLEKFFISSQDPQKVSLMFKSLAILMLPVAINVFGISEADFGLFVDGIVQLILVTSTLFGVLGSLYGAWRKVRDGRFIHPNA